ncbi:MAG: glycine cleavage system aminomethyltransferase GcvT [Panacagrimonas sp.]
MLKRTALYEQHKKLDARLVDFAGWEMPIQYQSQLDEHYAVRRSAGMFDVAHMQAVDISGDGATALLQRLLANDVAKLKNVGKALYSCMLNEHGGVLDDLIVYRTAEQAFRIVVNAGTADKDVAWFDQHATAFAVSVQRRTDLSILAVQGPQARQVTVPLLPDGLADAAGALKPFSACWEADCFAGRTGYTGEDGFELMLPHEAVVSIWQRLLAAGVAPCGLGARDTLRLEAGMNLYGQDMDETVTPLESGLAWTVAWTEGRDFIGRTVLEKQKATDHQRLIGLVLEDRGVLRGHMKLRFENGAQGEITSGGFAPTMKRSIALARVDANAEGRCEVEIRGKWLAAKVVKPPFVRQGEVLV